MTSPVLAAWLRAADGAQERKFCRGHQETIASLDVIEARTCEIVKTDVNEQTPQDEVRCRAFLRFYQYVTCDTAVYRQKVHRSLEQLVQQVNEMYAAGLKALVSILQENGFDEEEPQHILQ